jgi:hypothetical protein
MKKEKAGVAREKKKWTGNPGKVEPWKPEALLEDGC